VAGLDGIVSRRKQDVRHKPRKRPDIKPQWERVFDMHEDNGTPRYLQAQGTGSEQAFGKPSLILGRPPRPRDAPQPFASAAVDMVRRGLSIIPCGRNDGKKPSIKFWGRRPLGEAAIKKFAEREPDACVGLVTNLNKFTLVDIDEHNHAFANDIERHIGETPVVVRTPSGGRHLYYQSSGERSANLRRYDLPIDIKGNAPSYVIAPPSIRPSSGEPYYFERGSWELIRSLPLCDLTKIIPSNNNRPGWEVESIIKPPELIPGQRNSELFRFGLRQARNCDDETTLRYILNSYNEFADNPLPPLEVEGIARNAWFYESAGKNWVGGSARMTLIETEIRAVMPASNFSDAWFLYSMLMLMHGARAERGESFAICADAMAKAGLFGDWDTKRIRRARDTLIDCHLIACVHRGGRGKNDPSFYAFRPQPTGTRH
jgi:hypothetical protein